MTARKSTPVLFVDAIEPSLPFWDALGFSRTTEVPGDNGLAFVVLQAGDAEVMYQTIASLRADSAAHAAHLDGDKSFLFVEVDDIDAVAASHANYDMVMPRRQTFYGSTEIGFREPGGHFVTCAQLPPRA